MDLLNTLTRIVAITTWLIVGLYVWIPAVIFSIAGLVAIILYGAISQDVLLARKYRASLRHVLNLYRDGFVFINETLEAEGDDLEVEEQEVEPQPVAEKAAVSLDDSDEPNSEDTNAKPKKKSEDRAASAIGFALLALLTLTVATAFWGACLWLVAMVFLH